MGTSVFSSKICGLFITGVVSILRLTSSALSLVFPFDALAVVVMLFVIQIALVSFSCSSWCVALLPCLPSHAFYVI